MSEISVYECTWYSDVFVNKEFWHPQFLCAARWTSEGAAYRVSYRALISLSRVRMYSNIRDFWQPTYLCGPARVLLVLRCCCTGGRGGRVRETARKWESWTKSKRVSACVCVCVCVREEKGECVRVVLQEWTCCCQLAMWECIWMGGCG